MSPYDNGFLIYVEVETSSPDGVVRLVKAALERGFSIHQFSIEEVTPYVTSYARDEEVQRRAKRQRVKLLALGDVDDAVRRELGWESPNWQT